MTNPDEPAHPQHGWSSDPQVLERMKNQGGMTKREYFVARAMQGMLSSEQAWETADDKIAQYAVKIADATIAELNKPVPEGAKP